MTKLLVKYKLNCDSANGEKGGRIQKRIFENDIYDKSIQFAIQVFDVKNRLNWFQKMGFRLNSFLLEDQLLFGNELLVSL